MTSPGAVDQPATGRNYIAGRWLGTESGSVSEHRNPADLDEVTGRWPDSTPDDVSSALDAATAAFPAWSSMTVFERGRILHDALRELIDTTTVFEDVIIRENGKTRAEARDEIAAAIREMDHQIEEGIRQYGEEIPSSLPGVVALSRRVPLGVVALITPWNFPLNVPGRKAVPALITGNTCVLKPSSLTPRVAEEFVRCFERAGIPPGVMNLVHGSGSVIGRVLTEDPRVQAISFTGSTPVGLEIHARSSANLIRTQLEMGGKNPLVVLADADLEKAAEAAVTAAFACAGQWCTATSRVIVEDPVADSLVDAIRARLSTIVVGRGDDPETTMGPVCGKVQFDDVLQWIERGKSDGARVVDGGDRASGHELQRGCFVTPTLFTDVSPEMAIAQEEIFGPVLSVIKTTSLDSALEIANSVKFGLSSSVFTEDLDKAMTFIARTDVGLTHVNLHTAYKEPQAVFGGTKLSGVGIPEAGRSGLEFFTKHKVAYLKYH